MTATRPDTHHVGITVSDLETVLPFYRDVLDLSVTDRFSVSGPELADATGVDGASGSFVHLEGDAGGCRVELVEFEPVARDSPAAGLNQPGAAHVGLAVDDLEAFFENLPEDTPTVSEPRTTESGTTILFLRDPEENLVELLET